MSGLWRWKQSDSHIFPTMWRDVTVNIYSSIRTMSSSHARPVRCVERAWQPASPPSEDHHELEVPTQNQHRFDYIYVRPAPLRSTPNNFLYSLMPAVEEL